MANVASGEAGATTVNDAMINYSALELPMGGAKASGLGSRHGAGGIRNRGDLAAAASTGATAWLVASALHDRQIDYAHADSA